jgi:transposase-like protein
MTRRKSTGRPRRLRGVKSNMVAAAVELAGGVTAVAKLCGVARQSVYTWIEEWRVERLIDALKLARASGIPVERLAGEAFKPERIPAAKSPASSNERDEDLE